MDHIKLSFPVGIGQKNLKIDVKVVQVLLNKKKYPSRSRRLVVDGIIGPKTIESIKIFQAEQLHFIHPDGIISPTGKTLRALHYSVHPQMPTITFHESTNSQISEERYINTARCLNCEVAAVKAIAITETQHSPFLSRGRPYILFERHYFSTLTDRRYDSSHPEISSKIPYKHYGSYEMQYQRLNEAIKLDKEAAYRSASWGMFQIMGNNFRKAGLVTY